MFRDPVSCLCHQVYLPGFPIKVGCDTRTFKYGESHTHNYAYEPRKKLIFALPPPPLSRWQRYYTDPISLTAIGKVLPRG